MLHAGLDLSRKRIDVCLLSDQGELVDELACPPDRDGLRGLARRAGVHDEPVVGVIESMTGARFVHETLESLGWAVEIADAAKVKGLAPLAAKTDRIDARVLALLSQRDLVPAIWLLDPRVRSERELARFRLHLVKHRSQLKHRIHSTLMSFGRPCPVSDLWGGRSRAARLARGAGALARQRSREPQLIDGLEDQISEINSRLAGRSRPPLRSEAADGAGDRLGLGLHDSPPRSATSPALPPRPS
jgi:transposase